MEKCIDLLSCTSSSSSSADNFACVNFDRIVTDEMQDRMEASKRIEEMQSNITHDQFSWSSDDSIKSVDPEDTITNTTNRCSQIHSIYYNITTTNEPRIYNKKTLITHVPYYRDSDKLLLKENQRRSQYKYRGTKGKTTPTGRDRCIHLFHLSQKQQIEGKKRRANIRKSMKNRR
jgi:hypothetical protein